MERGLGILLGEDRFLREKSSRFKICMSEGIANSVKEAYDVITIAAAAHLPVDNMGGVFSMVWKVVALFKVQVAAWRLLWNRLPTIDSGNAAAVNLWTKLPFTSSFGVGGRMIFGGRWWSGSGFRGLHHFRFKVIFFLSLLYWGVGLKRGTLVVCGRALSGSYGNGGTSPSFQTRNGMKGELLKRSNVASGVGARAPRILDLP